MMKITSEGKIHEGKVFAIDPVTGTIVLKSESNNKSEYIIIPPSKNLQIEGNFNDIQTPDINSMGINLEKIEKQEMKAQEVAEKNIAGINFNVSNEIQSLFDKLAYVFPSYWEGDVMIILDDFIISPPLYDKVIIRNTNTTSVTGKDRIDKILDGERKKLGLKA